MGQRYWEEGEVREAEEGGRRRGGVDEGGARRELRGREQREGKWVRV